MTANIQNGGRGAVPWRVLGWGAAGLLLLTPLVAMQFTDEVKWTGFDFAFAAAMLGVVGVGLELAARVANSAYRLASALALGAAFLIVWATGAVGIVGDEGEPANLLFLGVPAVALLGAVLAGFRRTGMAPAMGAAALAQLAAPVVAWFAMPAAREALLRPEVPAATGVFTGLWLLSAFLYRKAAR